MWYVIYTTTGKEEELVKAVEKYISQKLCSSCFFIKRELLKRLGGRWVIVTEPLFSSYVFLETEKPDQLFYELKQMPGYAKLLGDNDGHFIPIEKEEEVFLGQLCNRKKKNFVAEITTVELKQNGEILRADGPLRFFLDRIIKMNLRKRFAVVELSIAGRSQTALLGIRLLKDLEL